MQKVITLVLCNRPQYTKTVIDALERCAGISDYMLLPRIEPGCEEVVELVRAIDFAEVRTTVNPERFGGGRNTYHAWEAGFNVSDFIVHIEDDTVPAPDCLRFMEHCRNAYRENDGIFSVASYNRYPCKLEQSYALSSRRGYTCWLVGIWKNRWEWAKQDWSPDRWRYATHLARRVVKDGLREVYPLLSRSQNIGIENGIHEHSARWHRVYHHTNHWAENLDSASRPFLEVPNPMVTAIMVTGMHPDRCRTAGIAIDCFKKQTYVHKELLIINHGDQRLDSKDDARITEIMVQKKQGETIGDLRNLGLRHAKGDLIIIWDDDDWHGPDRIAVQVAAQKNNGAVLLRRQIRYNVLNRSGFCCDIEIGIANTLLFPALPQLRYASLLRGEDDQLLENFDEITVIDNNPLLHVRTYDGLNLWDANHMMHDYADLSRRNQLDVPAAIRPQVEEITRQYIPPWMAGPSLRYQPHYCEEAWQAQ